MILRKTVELASRLCLCLISIQGMALADSLRPGGDTSVMISGPNAYSMPSANMSLSRRLDFSVGNSFFRNPWVSSPASTKARDGLGPLFNANACQACHIKDGRGHTPDGLNDSSVSLVVQLSVEPNNDTLREQSAKYGPIPHSVYGKQIQDFGTNLVRPEANISIIWSYKTAILLGGEEVTLRKPSIKLSNLQRGELNSSTKMSMRVAPPMIGLGLLESISESAILANEDEHDSDQDGISGKANRVWNHITRKTELGRFGWKAGQPNLMQQNAAAFNADMGITSFIFAKDDCQPDQIECLRSPNGGEFEVSDEILGFIEFYTRNLAVPARPVDSIRKYRSGRLLFSEIACANCHIPHFETVTLADQPEQSQQEIWPYTDLLLHDMGDELADERREFLANGREWRTPPLWGLSKLQEVNGHTQLLHDGRARNVQEAILWHGGEAEYSRDEYIKLPKKDREALVRFVESL